MTQTYRWNAERIAKAMQHRGWTRASQLAAGAGVCYTLAWYIVHSPEREIKKLDVDALERLRAALLPRAKTPWALLRRDEAAPTAGD